MIGRALLALAVAVPLASCGHGAAGGASALADRTTRAVYDDDVNTLQAQFDDDLKRQITLDQVATISSKLHALGDYRGLRQDGSDAARRRFDYTASFDRGSVDVRVRLDDDGKLAAYRVDVPVAVVP